MTEDKNLDYLKKLHFQYPFRKYQNMILSVYDDIKHKQNKFHIVAPPGSGKTIVGIELVRQLNSSAVIFSPTTTIQEQWKEKFAMFLPHEEVSIVDDIVSSNSKDLKTINTLTYQVLSTPTENKDFLKELAIKNWINDLEYNLSLSEVDAKERILILEKNNPESYSQEIAKYASRAKNELLTKDDFNVRDLLHTNAKNLIESFVENKTKVIVLDECHHLLDYWAIIIKELIKSLDNPFVIGLTATPPLSTGEGELENYLYLVGDIDFEIPTPAVVKEGNLAPYQDLVYLVTPTDKEMNFLKSQKELFLNLVNSISSSESFKAYFFNKIIGRLDKKGIKVLWKDFLNDNLELAIASIKYFFLTNVTIPKDILIIDDMKKPIEIDDWLILLEDYCLNFLKLSSESKDNLLLKDIKVALKSLGIVLSETGFRRYISATQRVLSVSDSKNKAVVEILKNEFSSFHDKLRATIIVDFEKSSATSLKSLEGILDPEAGGAVRVLRHLVEDSETNKLDAIMLTGTTILIDSDIAEKFVVEGNKWFKEKKLNSSLLMKATDDKKIIEIYGEGNDWQPRNYVRLTTSLFEKGITKCIIGTRGLLGEGWDSLSLNTLIDLTSAGTFATVNQIRGRSLRLDPSEPRKVANNWDVVCAAPGIPKGEDDFNRLIKKHSQFYGICANRKILKGMSHLDENGSLYRIYFMKSFSNLDFALFNNHILSKSRNRDKIYESWEIGKPYSNFIIHASEFKKEDLKFKTAYTFKKSLRRLLYIIIGNIVLHFFLLSRLLGASSKETLLLWYFVFALIVISISARYIYMYFKKAFIELPVDSYLKDFAKAILEALNNSGMLKQKISFDNIRVVTLPDNSYQVYLDYSNEKDIKLFNECFSDIMSPIINQRYLVSRDEASLDKNFFSPIWYFVRRITKVFRKEEEFYHPVPTVFAQNKKFVSIFAQSWAKYVGGGKLVYTHSDKGRDILLKNKIKNRLNIGITHLEEWR